MWTTCSGMSCGSGAATSYHLAARDGIRFLTSIMSSSLEFSVAAASELPSCLPARAGGASDGRVACPRVPHCLRRHPHIAWLVPLAVPASPPTIRHRSQGGADLTGVRAARNPERASCVALGLRASI